MSRSNASRSSRPVLTLAAALALQAAASLAWAGTTTDVEQADAVSFGARAGHDAAAARYYRPRAEAARAEAAMPADAAEVRASRAALAANYFRPQATPASAALTREQVQTEVARARAAGQLPHPYRPPFDENDPLRETSPAGMAQGLQPQDTSVN